MSVQRTNKKVKVVGTEQYINASTGELQTMQVTNIEDRDFNFHKVWMRNFISTLDIVGNQKTKVCFWIIDNLTKENQLLYTYRGISEATGISLDTVTKTMKALLDADFLRKGMVGYIVNPDIVYKGTRNGRLNVLNQYYSSEKIEYTIDEKIQNIKDSMETLAKQLDALEQQKQQAEKETA